MKDTAAIIVAGGKGLRFGGRVRKQYLKLGAHPLYGWCVKAFQRAPSIAEIILVVPKEDLKTVRFSKNLRVVAGGSTRAESVRAGLRAISSQIAWVAVHDAARPLVSPPLIEKVIRVARKFQAAIAATPSKDTVKLSNGNGSIASTPPRHSVWLAQTPQIFERRLLERAHRQGRNQTVTDDAQLVERLGVRVKLVPSPPENIKVTVPADFKIAKMILKSRGTTLIPQPLLP